MCYAMLITMICLANVFDMCHELKKRTLTLFPYGSWLTDSLDMFQVGILAYQCNLTASDCLLTFNVFPTAFANYIHILTLFLGI